MSSYLERSEYSGPRLCADQEEVRDALEHGGTAAVRAAMEQRVRVVHDAVRASLQELRLPVLRSSFRAKHVPSIVMKVRRPFLWALPDLYGVRVVTEPQSVDPVVLALEEGYSIHDLRRAPATHGVNGFCFPRVQILFDGTSRIAEVQVLSPELEARYEETRAEYERRRQGGVRS